MTEAAKQDRPKSQRLIRRFMRWRIRIARPLSWLLLVFLLPLAIYLTLGRLLMPLLDSQRDWLQSQLEASLGVEILVGELSGDWFAFSPILRLSEIEIIQSQDSPVSHSLQQLDVLPDIPRSLLRRQLIIDRIIIDEMSLLLVEDENGRWNLSGFAAGDSSNVEQLLEVLFNTSRLQLSESRLVLQPFDSAPFSINNIYLDIENGANEHQLQLQFRLNEQASPVQMAVRLNGDPMAQFTAQAFMDFEEIDLLPLINEGALPQALVSRFDSSGQLWLDFDEQGPEQAQALVQEFNLTADFPESSQRLEITTGSVELSARLAGENNWELWASNLQFDLFNRPWESGDFFLALDTREQNMAMDLQGEFVDLSIMTDMLDVLNLPDRARLALDDLNPQGLLRNLRVQTDLSGDYPDGFRFSGNLDGVAVNAWTQAPSGQGLNGYVEADSNSGLVELDSGDFTIHLPRIFDDSWHYNAINGRVYWLLENGRVRVHSDTIDVRNQNLHGRVQFELNNRQLPDDAGWDSDLKLLIGVLDFNVADKSLYLPNLSNIRGTMDWLDTALLSGRVENSAFLFRGKTSNVTSEMQRTVQTYYHVEDASLQFLSDWPILEDVQAFVRVDNNAVDVSTEAAQIANIRLGTGTAQIRPIQGSSGAWLSVDTRALAEGNVGLNFIRETPVRQTVGDFLDDWQLDGNVNLEIDLGIPLNNPGLENEIQVQAIMAGNSLRIPEYDLGFNDIYGPLSFTSTEGLRANGLSARLFDNPLAIRINTEDDTLMIRSNGRVSKTALQQWTLQPDFVTTLLDYAEGEFSYQTSLAIHRANEEGLVRSELDLSSDLLGIAFNLPRPFDKQEDENAPLSLKFSIGQRVEQLTLNFRDQINARLSFRADGLRGGEIYLGGRNENFAIRALNDAPGLLVNGSVSDFNLDEWEELAAAFGTGDESGINDLVRMVDVDIGNLHVFGLDLPAINTVLQRENNAWKLYLENPQVQGDFIFPDDRTQPYQVALTYLRLPRDEEPEAGAETDVEAEEVDVLEAVNPTRLPAIVFSTQEFSLGEGNLGAWSFTLRSDADGARITDLSMQSGDARITALNGEGGASIDWQYINGQHRSSFNGLFAAGNLAEVLPSFGYDAVVESETARFDSRLAWRGSPATFALKKVSGRVGLQMQNGSFIDIDSGSARLFGAFNFDTLVRRLQLDFSDLYERGLAFDSIGGVLDFNDGIVRTQNNFLIRGPSSTINVNGQLDLVEETIDADVLVNLPLGQNVSMVAGILGAWPIAITTYVASILFRDQLENFTTVLYRLEGPWDDPQAGFESDNEAVEEAMEEVGVLAQDAG